MLFKLVHLENALSGISVMSSGSVTVVKPVQSANAASSSVTPLGSRISVKLLQPENALCPIFSTLSGSTTPVSLLQFENA